MNDQDTTEPAHAFWAPSGVARWMVCNGAPKMEADCPDTQNAAAKEGDAAHWAAAEWMTKGVRPPAGIMAPNGVMVTGDMIDDVADYVTACLAINGTHHVEERIDIQRIHETDCWGTPDHWVFDDKATLYIDDLKYGWGLVETFYQQIAYAAGIIDAFPQFDSEINLCLRIHQPRPWHPLGPVREWRGNGADIRAIVNKMSNAANNEQKLATGLHCKYCKALLKCHPAHMAAMNAIDVTDYVVAPEPCDIGRELGILQVAFETIKNRLIAAESAVETKIKMGDHVPGWSLIPGQGRVNWIKEPTEILTLGDAMGINLRNGKPITPTQAKKKGMPEILVDENSEKKPGSYKLVKSDKTKASKAFKKE